MDEVGTIIVISLFLLRIGIPLAITFLITYLIDRFVTGKSPARTIDAETPEMDQEAPFFVPCWESKDCPPEKHAACQVTNRPGIPCWLTMQLTKGHLSTECLDCPVFHQTHVRTHQDSSV